MKNLMATAAFVAAVFVGLNSQSLMVTPQGFNPPGTHPRTMIVHPLPGGDLVITPEGYSPPTRP